MLSAILDHTENGTPIEAYSIKRYMRNHDRDQLWLIDVDVTGDVTARWAFLVHSDFDIHAKQAVLMHLHRLHGGDWKFDVVSVRLIPQRGRI